MTRCARPRDAERGAALWVATLLASVLALLALALLSLADLEQRIARNELRAAQALYVAEAGARIARHWFDEPGSRSPLLGSPYAEADRSARRIDPDGPGPRPARAAAISERYKWRIDRDGDGRDDLFDRPLRGGLGEGFFGTEDGPDVRIVDPDYLARLSGWLFGDFPDARRGVRARITEIIVYAPPRVPAGGRWEPRGVATVRVVGAIVARGSVVAQATVRQVIDEIAYDAPAGPLTSCADLELRARRDAPPASWGAVIASGRVRLVGDPSGLPPGPPRSEPRRPVAVDPVWGEDFAVPLERFGERLAAGSELGDPWFRLWAGAGIAGVPERVQPWPSAWLAWDGASTPDLAWVDHSNVSQYLRVDCPRSDHAYWKSLATAGHPGVRYFAWSDGDRFRERGRGSPRPFRDLTDGVTGVLFFDTRDGRPPAADGANLTPPIRITGGRWSVAGWVIVHAERFEAGGIEGRPVSMAAPGEPFEDRDADGRHDPGEPWLDLVYPARPDGTVLAAPRSAFRDRAGPPVRGAASLQGLLHTSGRYVAAGPALHFGAVVARAGVEAGPAGAESARIYWNAELRGEWPPAGGGLPRVAVVGWSSEPGAPPDGAKRAPGPPGP